MISTCICECHGAPMRWIKDSRYAAGGWWRCVPAENARRRARYDRDANFRIEELMRQVRQTRRKRLDKARTQVAPRQALIDFLRGVRDGTV